MIVHHLVCHPIPGYLSFFFVAIGSSTVHRDLDDSQLIYKTRIFDFLNFHASKFDSWEQAQNRSNNSNSC